MRRICAKTTNTGAGAVVILLSGGDVNLSRREFEYTHGFYWDMCASGYTAGP